jgi:hypothetical protein
VEQGGHRLSFESSYVRTHIVISKCVRTHKI